jgi:hypothetical protein
MRPLLILFAIALLSFKLPGDTATDMLGVKGPLQFNGVTFNLASATKPDAHFYIQEYLPDGQKFDSYEQMITINVLAKDITVNKLFSKNSKTWKKEKSPIRSVIIRCPIARTIRNILLTFLWVKARMII